MALSRFTRDNFHERNIIDKAQLDGRKRIEDIYDNAAKTNTDIQLDDIKSEVYQRYNALIDGYKELPHYVFKNFSAFKNRPLITRGLVYTKDTDFNKTIHLVVNGRIICDKIDTDQVVKVTNGVHAFNYHVKFNNYDCECLKKLYEAYYLSSLIEHIRRLSHTQKVFSDLNSAISLKEITYTKTITTNRKRGFKSKLEVFYNL